MIASTQTNHPLAGLQKGANQQAALEFATAKLKSAGLRITQPRLAILASLSSRAQPTSIEQIHESVGATTCDLVTIYRCMAAFEEIGLVRKLVSLPGVVRGSVESLEPHRVPFYLLELAGDFHRYYNKPSNRIISEQRELSLARLFLARVLMDGIKNGLDLLGVSAPDRM